jgi:membrane associated rhomboid family serine protease
MACVAPRAKFLVFGIIPVPAWGCVAGLFAYDFFNAVTEKVSQLIKCMDILHDKFISFKETGISEISHLAGILSGIAYFVRLSGRFPTF